MTHKISRRALFNLPSDERTEKSFSLDAFYARRPAAPAELPQFAVKAPVEPVETTNVGVTRAAVPPWEVQQRNQAATELGGPVTIVRSACLAWQGSACWVCSERCPVEKAIVLDDAGRPTVDVTRCNGCGECVAACPAPHNAIKLAAHSVSS
ncbi:MAG TPA: 4Fe-4S binding protein [Polyangiales bacterium]|nr:4Fe-4S binding protein [Polyangiales bacterium]